MRHAIVIIFAVGYVLVGSPQLKGQIVGLDGPWTITLPQSSAVTYSGNGIAHSASASPPAGPSILLEGWAEVAESPTQFSRSIVPMSAKKYVSVGPAPALLTIESTVKGQLCIADSGGRVRVNASVAVTQFSDPANVAAIATNLFVAHRRVTTWQSVVDVDESGDFTVCLQPGSYLIKAQFDVSATMTSGIGGDHAYSRFKGSAANQPADYGFSATFGQALCPGQTQVSGLQPGSSSGACVVPQSPLSNGGTLVYRLPASGLAGIGALIRDIAFAPCGSGRWQGDDVLILVGHLPSTAPSTVTLPSVAYGGSVLTPGDLSDVEILRQGGPFGWNALQDQWSPLGLHAAWPWNGMDDVLVVISYAGLDLAGGWNGSLHTASWELGGFGFAPTHQAGQVTLAGTPVPKIQVNPHPLPRFEVTEIEEISSTLTLSGVPATAIQGFTLLSFDDGPLGTGLLLGLHPDNLTWDILGLAPSPGNPFAWTGGAANLFPSVPLVLPAASTAPLAGLTMDALIIVSVPTPSGPALRVSDLTRIYW